VAAELVDVVGIYQILVIFPWKNDGTSEFIVGKSYITRGYFHTKFNKNSDIDT
jgi:hypothetical protein